MRDPVSIAQALLRCPSVTPRDCGAQDVLQSLLESVGFTVHRLTFSEPGTSDVDNTYARFGAQSPNLCFAGHTDVVPPGEESEWTYPPFGAEIHGGVIYGRGAVDMKGAIACFVAAAARSIERRGGLRGSVSLLITGDEEGAAINGTSKVLNWLVAQEEKLDACLVGEPSCPSRIGDMIKIGRRGSVTAHIAVQGKQGHAAYPQLADNPVPKLARIIDRLSSISIDSGSDAFEPSRLQFTLISVPNTAANVIPGHARATLNVRYNDNWTRPKMEAWIREQCHAAAESVDAHFDLAFEGTGDVFLTKPGGQLVDATIAAVQSVTGLVPKLSTSGGTSDARFIQAYCPVIELGLVNKTIHQIDECCPVDHMHQLTSIYERLIEGYFA
ncbi:MAG: succinyl-diaminopimelate desuccinylase [Hyphomicrobiaceae bacterium]